MRVVVTGGEGYLGSVLVEVLAASGYEVTVIDRGRRSCSRSAKPSESVRVVAADIRGIDWTQVVQAGDAVVHLAALVGAPACARNPQEAETVNHLASVRLAAALAEVGAGHMVFASTCSNYGASPTASAVIDETADLAPLSLYARTKVAVEQRLLDGEYPFAIDILRLGTLFGLSPAMRFDLTVNEFTRDLSLGRHLVVYAPKSWRPYVHTIDASLAILRCLSLRPTVPRVVNVGSDVNNSTKLGIVRTVERVLGRTGSVAISDHGDDGRDYRVSFERLRNDLGLLPERTIEDGVREIAEALCGGVFEDPFADRYVVL